MTGWTILDERGMSALNFTSFIDINLSDHARTLTCPIEEGGFATYNKVQAPLDIKVVLSTQGDNSLFNHILNRLEQYKEDACLLFIVTPAAFYENMTLVGYSYRRSRESGAGQLTVELAFKEIMKNSGFPAWPGLPKNPTSAGEIMLGKTQAVVNSALSSLLRTAFG